MFQLSSSITQSVDGQTIQLALWDTSGNQHDDQKRALSYADTDVVLICFSIGSPDTLQESVNKWAMEVKHQCPGIPVL